MTKWLRKNRGFLIFLLLFGLLRTAVADWNPIPSGSMRPTILEGDVVLINRLAFDLKVPLTNVIVAHLGEPQRGDIVTFFSPRDGVRLIKRLVALPGDTVEMRDKVLRVNGEAANYRPITIVEQRGPDAAVDALRLYETRDESTDVMQRVHIPDGAPGHGSGPLVLPPGHYVMLGDNRDN